ncbi:MAG TPA: YciI family protein [Bryobacteraceae bacterium]
MRYIFRIDSQDVPEGPHLIKARGTMVTDEETEEQLAGYYILECGDLDEAIEWAGKIPTTGKNTAGCIEVRAVANLPKRQSCRANQP